MSIGTLIRGIVNSVRNVAYDTGESVAGTVSSVRDALASDAYERRDAYGTTVMRAAKIPSDLERTELDGVPIAHRFARHNGVRLHYVEAGPANGEPVVLVHGFPQSWYTWRKQIPELARAGYRVIAPDMRGFNRSEKPQGVEHYTFTELTADLVSLIDKTCGGRASVVAHDWGGVVAWQLAMRHPASVKCLVTLAAPHPEAYDRAVWTDAEQRSRSRYVFVDLQAPGVGELQYAWNDYAKLRHMFTTEPTTPGAYTAEDIEHYVGANRGEMGTQMNYYRAALQIEQPRETRIEQPVLYLWGDKDAYQTEAAHEVSRALVPNLETVRLHDKSHWLMADAPEQVNAHLLDFLARDGGKS